MPGFDINLFVNVEDWLSKELICGICRNIFDKAVTTLCGHSFCRDCIEQTIKINDYLCPACRQPLNVNASEAYAGVYEDYYEYGQYHGQGEATLIKSHTIDGIISRLKVKCYFESNGCKTVVELGSLSTHSAECQFRFCRTCDLLLDVDECKEHNCFERMTIEMFEYKNKFNELEKKYNELEKKCKELEANIGLSSKKKSINGHGSSRRGKDSTVNTTLQYIDNWGATVTNSGNVRAADEGWN